MAADANRWNLSDGQVKFLAGSLGSCTSKTVFAPLQRVTVLMQLGKYPHLSIQGHIDVIMKEKNGGVRAFWKGNLYSICQRFPFSGSNYWFFLLFRDWLHALVASRRSSTVDVTCNAVASAAAACLATVLVFPMEVMRTRTMSGEPKFQRGIVNTFLEVKKGPGGWLNFYGGLSPALLQRVPDMALNMTVYQTVRGALKRRGWDDGMCVIAGSTSAALASVALLYPFDVAKRRMSMRDLGADGTLKYKGTWDCIRSVYADGGLRAVYRGAGIEAVRCVPQVCLMWYITEQTLVHLSPSLVRKQHEEMSRKQ